MLQKIETKEGGKVMLFTCNECGAPIEVGYAERDECLCVTDDIYSRR